MAVLNIKSMRSGLLPMAALSVLLLVSLYLMSAGTQNSDQFGRVFFLLLLINILGLVTLVVLIGANMIRLVRQYRNRATGSRLTVRLVVIFVVLSLLPVSVVFYFSIGFIQHGIDSWFNVRIEQALDDSLVLTRVAFDDRKRELLNQTERSATRLTAAVDAGLAAELNEARQQTNAEEMLLMSPTGQFRAFATANPVMISPQMPPLSVLKTAQQQGKYVSLDASPGGSLFLRVIVPVVARDNLGSPSWLQAVYPVSGQISRLADSVQVAAAEYKRLTLLRNPLKFSFTLTLSLVLLLSCLTAVWAAFFSARRLVAPIRALAIGTRSVASGDYDRQLPLHSNDELGFLVRSFNEMTRILAHSRDEVRKSQHQVERERAYLRAVLGRLSSGVLTLDRQRNIRTVNAASSQILGIDLKRYVGQPLYKVAEDNNWMREFADAIREHLGENEEEWREEIVLFGNYGRQILICAGSTMISANGRSMGDVIVFDDMTALVQAQHDAAWGEVARRLAHEIKNPLTPIKLSAERLRHKYLPTLPAADAELLERATHTIIEQVGTMQEMVNAFSEYARAPKLAMRPLSLNAIINEVLDLYHEVVSGIRFETVLDPALVDVEADAGRMRQLLHNLLKNAIEALQQTDNARITVVTTMVSEGAKPRAELRVEDNGPGIPASLLTEVFDPYVTSKTKGSGLGLAIVKKIVEEHGGMIRAVNRQVGGTCIVIQLPVIATVSAATSDNRILAETGQAGNDRMPGVGQVEKKS